MENPIVTYIVILAGVEMFVIKKGTNAELCAEERQSLFEVV